MYCKQCRKYPNYYPLSIIPLYPLTWMWWNVPVIKITTKSHLSQSQSILI